MIVIVMSELSWLKIESRFFLMFGCKLRLAGRHYTFGVVLFAELVRQKLPYANKGTIGHGYTFGVVLFAERSSLKNFPALVQKPLGMANVNLTTYG